MVFEELTLNQHFCYVHQQVSLVGIKNPLHFGYVTVVTGLDIIGLVMQSSFDCTVRHFSYFEN